MNTNPAKNLTPARAFDALDLFEPGLLVARDQPTEAQMRKPACAKANAEHTANEGEDHPA
ncbi:hypothetical protein MX652_03580 [Thauera aromatica]|nr:hypothetical protein [Thauera aromatica]MCK2125770.1 hypothetical protein [Thauera aromatica]